MDLEHVGRLAMSHPGVKRKGTEARPAWYVDDRLVARLVVRRSNCHDARRVANHAGRAAMITANTAMETIIAVRILASGVSEMVHGILAHGRRLAKAADPAYATGRLNNEPAAA